MPSTASPQITQGSFVGRGWRGLQFGHRWDGLLRVRLDGVSGTTGPGAKMDICRAWPQLAQWRWKSRPSKPEVFGSPVIGSWKDVIFELWLPQYWLVCMFSASSLTAPILRTSLCCTGRSHIDRRSAYAPRYDLYSHSLLRSRRESGADSSSPSKALLFLKVTLNRAVGLVGCGRRSLSVSD